MNSILAAVYVTAMNLTGLVMMGMDKQRARNRRWRIPERSFFLVSLLGGSAGCWAGMYLFRHKTRHWYFVAGMPLILAVQVFLCCLMRAGG